MTLTLAGASDGGEWVAPAVNRVDGAKNAPLSETDLSGFAQVVRRAHGGPLHVTEAADVAARKQARTVQRETLLFACDSEEKVVAALTDAMGLAELLHLQQSKL